MPKCLDRTFDVDDLCIELAWIGVMLDCSIQNLHRREKRTTPNGNVQWRRVTKTRSAFPTDDSVRKALYLAIKRASNRWSMPIQDWLAALELILDYVRGKGAALDEEGLHTQLG